MTTSFRSVHFDDFGHTDDEPESMIVGLTGARSVHGDTEGITPEGYHVNTGSYVHVDDVADYLDGEAKQMRSRATVSDPLRPSEVAEMLSAMAFIIRSGGV